MGHTDDSCTLTAVPNLFLIFASTAGHTEYVTDVLMRFLQEIGDVTVERKRAELCTPEDLLKGDLLLLACGTWNTGGIEGQLNPYMHRLLKEQAAKSDLAGKRVACVALGDERYHYTAEAKEHLEQFVRSHGGEIAVDSLVIVNEPYGQEEKVREWGRMLLSRLSA